MKLYQAIVERFQTNKNNTIKGKKWKDILIKKCTVRKLMEELKKHNPNTKIEVADDGIDSSNEDVYLEYYEHNNTLDIYSSEFQNDRRIELLSKKSIF